jgi:hypothetical protein
MSTLPSPLALLSLLHMLSPLLAGIEFRGHRVRYRNRIKCAFTGIRKEETVAELVSIGYPEFRSIMIQPLKASETCRMRLLAALPMKKPQV